MVFEGSSGMYERIFFLIQMSEKEREICEFEMAWKNFFVSTLIQVMITQFLPKGQV